MSSKVKIPIPAVDNTQSLLIATCLPSASTSMSVSTDCDIVVLESDPGNVLTEPLADSQMDDVEEDVLPAIEVLGSLTDEFQVSTNNDWQDKDDEDDLCPVTLVR